MIDLHCHILPSVDDGSDSLETSVEMCRIAYRDGITHVVATPHANFEYRYDREAHRLRLEELQRQVPELHLLLGCDLQLSFENFTDALENPGRYTIGNTRYLLVELSEYGVPRATLDALYRLHQAGLITIVTHPERNPMLSRRFELLREMVGMGSILQITANSLTGFWGQEARRSAEKMLKSGLVGIIASDAHSPSGRTPVLSWARDAAAGMIGAQAAGRLVEDYPAMVLADKPIEMPDAEY